MNNNRMMIGAFNDPNPSFENYRLLKESGINTVFVNRKKTKEQMLDILTWADELDLNIFVDVQDHEDFFLDEDIIKHRSFIGHHIYDEPVKDDFPKIQSFVDKFNDKFNDDKIFYVNLCCDQWDSCKKKLGFNSYYEFVEEHIKNTLLKLKGRKILSVDSYPLMHDYNDLHECLDNRHLEILELFQMMANKYNLETHLYIQTMAYGKFHRKPEMNDMRFQFFVGFAYGFKQFTHFCYYTPGGISSNEFDIKKDYAMVYKNDELSDIYYFVKEANAEAQIFYKVIKNFKWVRTSFIDGTISFNEYKGKEYLRDGYGKISGLSRVVSTFESIIGEFDNDNKKAYIVVNYTDPFQNKENDIEINFENNVDLEIHIINKTMNISCLNEPLKIHLKPGEGAIILVK